MLTTVMFTDVTLRRSDGKVTMHVPLPPRSPVVQVVEFVPSWLQCPTTVAPFSRLILACTVISTVADHLFPLLDVTASRSPTCMVFGPGGAFTMTFVEAWLLAGLSSVRSWLPASVWFPVLVLVLVVQLNGTVALAPSPSPWTS